MVSENKVPLIYQDITEEMSYDSLPAEWLHTNFAIFSDTKSLFDYQRNALKNGLKLLHYYFENLQNFDASEESNQIIDRKKKFFQELRKYDKSLTESLGVSNKHNKLLFNKLKQYYPVVVEEKEERINFLHFVNRMSFWMATGSGKTLVLVKLIEMLDQLKSSKLIPNNDIMILTHREDLIEQIVKLIQEFNRISSRKIRVWELTKFEEVKRGTILAFKEDINVFIYRSDLIAEDTKEKQIGFEDVENGGKWYLLLDEAHKGDKEDSKRQLYYSLFTRNGFLFNFSATFTDIWDILTTVYNFNLDNFIRQGYGKNVYLSQQELNAFKDKSDFNDKDKQAIVLKTLVLFTLSVEAKCNIDAALKEPSYHKPLLVSLVNSVNTQDADLELFFKALEQIASEDIDIRLFNEVKEELSKELFENPKYVFGNERLNISNNRIHSLQLKDVRRSIFHTERKGSIEVLKIPGNEKELIFKLKTTELPFALMRIGDCGKWVKEKLTTYHIEETYDNESYFKHLDEGNNNINILMGSRAFYEGWDSNRPNVMLFINIGRGEAKKYVIQSIGRGVRIQPFMNKRKRLQPLKRENDTTAKDIYSHLEPADVSIIETLFVLGTNRANVQQILEGIMYENKASGELIELRENPLRKDKSLLIPVYKDWSKIVPVEELPKFEGNKTLIKAFVEWIGDERVLYALSTNTNANELSTIRKAKEFLEKGNFLEDKSPDALYQLSKLLKHVNIKLRDLDEFRELSDEIVHFKKIHVDLPEKDFERLGKIITSVCEYQDASKKEIELKKQFSEHQIDLDTFTAELKNINNSPKEAEFLFEDSSLKIKNILNHYFIPVIVSDKEKINYLNHIITVESERRFIEQLEEYVNGRANRLKEFDWWMFSKIDEHLDEVHIPYYNKSQNTIARFKPDFIFWMKKGNDYHILFADPKGTMHTDYQFKVDGYQLIFEINGKKKVFSSNGNNIQVHLFLFTEDRNKLAEGYKKFWFDDFEKMVNQFLCSGNLRLP